MAHSPHKNASSKTRRQGAHPAMATGEATNQEASLCAGLKQLPESLENLHSILLSGLDINLAVGSGLATGDGITSVYQAGY